MYRLLSFFLTCFCLVVSSSDLLGFHAIKSDNTIAQQLIKQMEAKKTDVCVIGFNVGRANTFIHINKTKKDMFIVDCGYNKNRIYAQKIIDIIEGMKGYGFTLQAIIISHWHSDHYNFLDVPVSGNMSLRKYLTREQCTWIVPKKNDESSSSYYNNTHPFQYSVKGNSRVSSISVRSSSQTNNSSSLVVHIDGVVYTGDIDSGTLNGVGENTFRGMVFPHHGSVTGTSRDIRNQIINTMASNAAKFVFIPNDNRTSCKLGVGIHTPKKIAGLEHQLVGIERIQNPNVISTPMKVNVKRKLFASDDGCAKTHYKLQVRNQAKISDSKRNRTRYKPFVKNRTTIAGSKKKPVVWLTPIKRNVNKEELPKNFIFTSDDDDAIAQCVMFNSNIAKNPNAYRFMIRDDNVTAQCMLTPSVAKKLEWDAEVMEISNEQ